MDFPEVQAIVAYAFTIYQYMIIVYILMSWIPNARASFIGELIGKIVEPYLMPFRRIIPPIGGMLDISPIVAIFALYFVQLGLLEVIRMIFY